jgi:hypothetical protein
MAGTSTTKKPSDTAMSLVYAYEMMEQTPEETLAAALLKAMASAGLGKNVPLLQLSQHVADDLRTGRLKFAAASKMTRVHNGYNIDELTDPITDGQIGYIAGLTEKLKLDRYNLPLHISPKSDYKELTEGEAILVIDTLIKMTSAL